MTGELRVRQSAIGPTWITLLFGHRPPAIMAGRHPRRATQQRPHSPPQVFPRTMSKAVKGSGHPSGDIAHRMTSTTAVDSSFVPPK